MLSIEIVQINQNKADSVAIFKDIVEKTSQRGRKSVLLLIHRTDVGDTIFTALPIKKSE